MYPALAVADWLIASSREQPPAICWVGSRGGVEENLVTRAGIPFEGIPAAGLRGKNPLATLNGLWTLSRGFRQARRLVAAFRPDVLFITGGYVCAPVTLAARLAGVPVLIYLPDMEPGLAIKFLARFADRVAVTAQPVVQHFRPGQAVVTGYPVRRELFARRSPSDSSDDLSRQHPAPRPDLAQSSDDLSRQHPAPRPDLPQSSDDLSRHYPVLLVFGGSQGAHSINRAVIDGIEALLEVAQVIHVSGRRDAEWTQARRASLPESLRARYHLHDYLHEEMIDALLAADLAVSRAGASTLGEFPAAGLPAVLVPYPYAGAHQWANARYLVEAGAAVAIADADLGRDLIPTVLDLLADHDRRAAMSRAARSLARPDAAQNIAHELKELAR